MLSPCVSQYIKSVMRLDELLSRVKEHIRHSIAPVELEVERSVGCISAENVVAPVDIPCFNRSVVDGYAVRAESTYSASESSPVVLRISRGGPIGHGEAAEVSTGDILPEGSDAVVMYEDAIRREGVIEVYKPVTPFQNVSVRGEDIRAGDVVVERGHRVSSIDVAVLKMFGINRIRVFRPKIALACTGDEIEDVEDISKLKHVMSKGRTPNVTGHLIKHYLESMCYQVDYYGVLKDDADEIRKYVERAIEDHDVVLVTGGASVGKRDHTWRAILELKPELYQRGVAIRPGRPTTVAVKMGKPVVVLSGFPVAAWIGVEYIVRPIVHHMIGAQIRKMRVYARLTRRVTKPAGLRAFVRVRLCLDDRGNIVADPISATGSGLVSTLLRSHGVLVVPEEREGFDENELVEVEVLREVERCGSR